MFERNGSPFEYFREFNRSLERSIRDKNRRDSSTPQMLRGKLTHFARADDHHDFARQGTKDLSRQLDGRIADGNGRLRNARLTPDTLGNSESAAHQCAEVHADGAGIACDAVGFLHLAENLRLADHHRVETRRNAENVTDRIRVPEGV